MPYTSTIWCEAPPDQTFVGRRHSFIHISNRLVGRVKIAPLCTARRPTVTQTVRDRKKLILGLVKFFFDPKKLKIKLFAIFYINDFSSYLVQTEHIQMVLGNIWENYVKELFEIFRQMTSRFIIH